MLQQITPVVLTHDEAPNIGRVLARVAWAKDVVVVDSLSADATRRIASGFANVRVVTRPFDSHPAQWRFAIDETGIATEWVLRLDADHVLTDEIIGELANLAPPPDVDAYLAPFTYCVHGQALRGSAYMPSVRLVRRGRIRLYQDGHTERVATEGRTLSLRNSILHDDRKPLERFLASQSRYMRLEADALTNGARTPPRLIDRLRRSRFFAPFVVLTYCLFVKRLAFDGLPGIFYVFQRVLAELTLSLYLIDEELKRRERVR